MLKSLKIKNGEMPLKFDSYNTIYTITVEENTDYLDLEYLVEEEDEVSIVGNESFHEGKNEVVLTVYNENDITSYYLYVYKEAIEEVNSTQTQALQLEFNKQEEIWEYAIPVISATCFLSILILFSILFRKKKKNKN